MWLRNLLWLVMLLVAVRAFGRFFVGVSDGARARAGAGGSRRRPSQAESPVKMVQDPVCGTFVVPGKALSLPAGDTTHWFCSEQCRSTYASRA